jgi:hypothetical protein
MFFPSTLFPWLILFQSLVPYSYTTTTTAAAAAAATTSLVQ